MSPRKGTGYSAKFLSKSDADNGIGAGVEKAAVPSKRLRWKVGVLNLPSSSHGNGQDLPTSGDQSVEAPSGFTGQKNDATTISGSSPQKKCTNGELETTASWNSANVSTDGAVGNIDREGKQAKRPASECGNNARCVRICSNGASSTPSPTCVAADPGGGSDSANTETAMDEVSSALDAKKHPSASNNAPFDEIASNLSGEKARDSAKVETAPKTTPELAAGSKPCRMNENCIPAESANVATCPALADSKGVPKSDDTRASGQKTVDGDISTSVDRTLPKAVTNAITGEVAKATVEKTYNRTSEPSVPAVPANSRGKVSAGVANALTTTSVRTASNDVSRTGESSSIGSSALRVGASAAATEDPKLKNYWEGVYRPASKDNAKKHSLAPLPSVSAKGLNTMLDEEGILKLEHVPDVVRLMKRLADPANATPRISLLGAVFRAIRANPVVGNVFVDSGGLKAVKAWLLAACPNETGEPAGASQERVATAAIRLLSIVPVSLRKLYRSKLVPVLIRLRCHVPTKERADLLFLQWKNGLRTDSSDKGSANLESLPTSAAEQPTKIPSSVPQPWARSFPYTATVTPPRWTTAKFREWTQGEVVWAPPKPWAQPAVNDPVAGKSPMGAACLPAEASSPAQNVAPAAQSEAAPPQVPDVTIRKEPVPDSEKPVSADVVATLKQLEILARELSGDCDDQPTMI